MGLLHQVCKLYEALQILIDIYSPHWLPVPQDMSLFSSLVFIKTGCAEVTFHATAGHRTKITHVFVMYFKVSTSGW